MIELSTYIFETLRKDGEFALYRGRRQDDGKRLLVKEPISKTPSSRGLGQLEHEYSLKEELNPAWAAQPLALQRRDGRTVLLLNDPGGELPNSFLGRPWELREFLRWAIAVAGALSKVHQAGFLHKNLKSANILAEMTTGRVWLTGFGFASRLRREHPTPGDLEGLFTLAYLAPEQTGRMNRSIDSRSDLYSYGAILYEMLTGVLPLTFSEPAEWLHALVARRPKPPKERVEQIPETISAIVMKLLAKDPEERYQTAISVEADLRRCLAEILSLGRIEAFALGAHDISDRFLIPEKLYGRDRECQDLLRAFDRVVESGHSELLLVSGYSGTGKSSIVNELHKALVPLRGLFAVGKFDQYKRDIPYATLARAFQGLLRQILGENETELASWRESLREVVGPNGQLMVGLVPELELVIGKQPPVPALLPQDAQNRFQTVLLKFIGAFARAKHPLALFLDDLQWLDTATLDLLKHLVTGHEVRHLLVVGAYRDNEVGPTHPLKRTLEEIRQAGAELPEIVLGPLSIDDVDQLIMDSLHCEADRSRPLAQHIHQKTGGNPFFASQFLANLAEEGLLVFEPKASAWAWDLPRIQAKRYTDDVVELMSEKLQRLPRTTQAALKQLACLGNSSEIATLNLVYGETEESMKAELWEAARVGLISRSDGAYAFLHDRIREAAYSLMPESERAATHLKIGRLLVSSVRLEESNEEIFEIVNQLNRATPLIRTLDERKRVAKLNLAAGQRAKISGAYASALSYFAASEALLSGDCWDHDYALAFEVALQRAECQFQTGRLAEAEERLSMLWTRAVDQKDLSAVACLRVGLFMTLARFDRAVEVCLEYFRQSGIGWSAHPTEDDLGREYAEVWRQLGDRSIEELVDLPLMNDPDGRAMLDVLSACATPAWFTDGDLHDLVVGRMVNLSLQRGNSDGSCYAYAVFGTILGSKLREYEMGFRFGQLGLALVEERGLDRFKARVYSCFGHHILPWTRHLHDGRPWIRRAFNAAKESGDLTFAAFSSSNMVANLLAGGDALDEVQREADQGLVFARKRGFGLVADFVTGQLGLIKSLRGLTAEFGSFNDGKFDENRFEQHLAEDPRLAIAACRYWIRKLQAHFYAENYLAALRAASRADFLLRRPQSFFEIAEYPFFRALTHAAAHALASPEEKPGHLAAVAADYGQIEAWAKNSPENFGGWAALLAAEMARLEGRELDAEQQYEQAIRLSRQQGFIQNEALAHEVAARFYLARGLETTARAFLQKARHLYLRWGALGKVRQLERRYPGWGDELPPAPGGSPGSPLERVDTLALAKASQAVSSELDLEKLVETLLAIALENAGAERGVLILLRGEEAQVVAEAFTSDQGVKVNFCQLLSPPAELPDSIVRYVIRTQESIILDDALVPNQFSEDEYIQRKQARSVLCLPLARHANLKGVLYLENNLTSHAFTPDRILVLQLLVSQAAITLDHARLYADLKQENNDRRKAETALRTSEERLQDIVDNTSAIILVKDLQFHYLLVNREYERQYNIERDHIRGKTDFDIHPPDFAEKVRASDLQVIEGGEPIQIEETGPTAQGERHYVVVKFLLRDGTGKPYALCGIATDITASKRAAEKIRDHALKISQANEVLKRSLNGLAQDKNLHRFVDQVLVVLTEQLGAHSSTLWLIDVDSHKGWLQSICQDGQVVPAENAAHPNALEPQVWKSDDPTWIALQNKRPFLDYDAVHNPFYTPAQQTYLSTLGVGVLVSIPLIFGEQLIGRLTVRISPNRQVSEEEVDFAQALAQQVTLALELGRLAEQAEQTGIVIEKERAAREHAAELAKANEVLLECLDALASVSDLDESLGQVMAAMTRQLGAASSILRLRNFETDSLGVDLVFQDGRAMTPTEAKYPEKLQNLPLDERQLGILKGPATVMRLLDHAAPIPDRHRSYLIGLEAKTLLIIPLTISGQLIGSLTFRFREDRDFQREEIEIARALASQTSLAIQLTRLAKAARQSAVLAERNDLAGEIHDSLAQFFTGISMQLGAAKEVSKTESGNVLSYIQRASELAQFGLAEARRSAFSLQPAIIEESGLVEALKKLVERSNIPGRVRCNFHSIEVPEERLSASVQQGLLRIAQEAISNAVRHAQPTVINVNLRYHPPDMILEVIDNGSGIADSEAASKEGFGFSNMRSRADNIGAQLEVRTARNRGTSIIVHAPVEGREME